jgi:hypothetical protein
MSFIIAEIADPDARGLSGEDLKEISFNLYPTNV